MRRGQEVLLDFTTLLDVTMLLLFFFVLFSRMDVDQVKQSAAADQRAAQSVMDEARDLKNKAENELADAQAQKAQAEEALRQLNDADAQRAADLAALQYYGIGQNLKLRLELDGTTGCSACGGAISSPICWNPEASMRICSAPFFRSSVIRRRIPSSANFSMRAKSPAPEPLIRPCRTRFTR